MYAPELIDTGFLFYTLKYSTIIALPLSAICVTYFWRTYKILKAFMISIFVIPPITIGFVYFVMYFINIVIDSKSISCERDIAFLQSIRKSNYNIYEVKDCRDPNIVNEIELDKGYSKNGDKVQITQKEGYLGFAFISDVSPITKQNIKK